MVRKLLFIQSYSNGIYYKRELSFQTSYELSDIKRPNHSSITCSRLQKQGEMMKLLGNAPYGKCITNLTRHKSVKIVTESQYPKYIAKDTQKSHEDFVDGYEFRLKNTSFKQNLPIQIGLQFIN